MSAVEARANPPSTKPPEPGAAHAEYSRRLLERRGAAADAERWEQRVADTRLGVFLVALLLLVCAFWGHWLSWTWVGLPLVVFAVLVVVHDGLKRRARRLRRAAGYYERGLRRLDGTWPGSGVSGSRFATEGHPYAADLDLFGVGSLFERLCTARTRAGEDVLASWLLGPADPTTIGERQGAVAELRPSLDLREDLELIGAEVREGIDPDALAAWGRAPGVFSGRAVGVGAAVLAVLAMTALVLLATDLGYLPLFSVIFFEVAFFFLVKRQVRQVIEPIERRAHDLVILAELLRRLEREELHSPPMTRLRAALQTGEEPASKRIARLARLVNLLEAKDNQVFAPIAALLLWPVHLALALDAWRVRTGPEIAGWLAAAGEFEALSSLASFAFENPADPFPEVVLEGAVYDAEGLGHPLIAPGACVRNDVSLGTTVRVLLVSGSNMSGKSTLLRTVGTNAVLALAGAPVRARRLRLSVVSVGATLRVQDSLQTGTSRFYAEITRVRQLVGQAEGPRPLLFLLDEIFHGTNSHDRVIGAGAVVRGLIDRGAIGLVTTHDLALAALADELAPRAQNVHFEDQLIGGTMHFDYRMRPGVVQHSNALALMRAVGLDV